MTAKTHKLYIGVFVIIGTLVTFLIILKGYSYYSTQIAERFHHSDYNLFKPSGIYGHGFGIVGTFFILLGTLNLKLL